MSSRCQMSVVLVGWLVSIGPVNAVAGAEYLFAGRVYEGVPWEQDEPIQSVTVELWGGNTSGQLQQLINTTQTDGSGWYGLLLDTGDWAFDYYIIWEKNSAGYVSTDAKTVGGTRLNADQIQFGWPLDGVDFSGNKFWDKKEGQEPPAGGGTIRGTKFNDIDGNGQRDTGEPGLVGWQITLADDDGNVLATVTTDANGDYEFTGVEPGVYRVDEVQQSGWRQSSPEVDGQPAFWAIGLEPDAVVEDADFGNLQDDQNGWASIGDFVWEDLNRNGLQDAGEPGIVGVMVSLLDDTGFEIASMPTLTNGFYEFGVTVPGSYRVRFALPTGFAFSPEGQGNDEAIDSDVVDPSAGETWWITLAPGEHNDFTDAGMYRLDVSNAQYDYGDAPEGLIDGKNYNYSTTLANNGARHRIVAVGPCLRMTNGWPRPDAEPDGQPNIHASGDDISGDMDEYAAWSLGWPFQGRVCQARVYVDGGGRLRRCLGGLQLRW